MSLSGSDWMILHADHIATTVAVSTIETTVTATIDGPCGVGDALPRTVLRGTYRTLATPTPVQTAIIVARVTASMIDHGGTPNAMRIASSFSLSDKVLRVKAYTPMLVRTKARMANIDSSIILARGSLTDCVMSSSMVRTSTTVSAVGGPACRAPRNAPADV